MTPQQIISNKVMPWTLIGLLLLLLTAVLITPAATADKPDAPQQDRQTSTPSPQAVLITPPASPEGVALSTATAIPFIATLFIAFTPTVTDQETAPPLIQNQAELISTPHLSHTITPTPSIALSPTPLPSATEEAVVLAIADTATPKITPTASESLAQTAGFIQTLASPDILNYAEAKTRLFSSTRLLYPADYLYIDDSYTDLLKWHEWDRQTIDRYLLENYGYPAKEGGIGRYSINEQEEFVIVPRQSGPGVLSYMSFTPYQGRIENLGQIKIWVDGLLVVDEAAGDFFAGRSHHSSGLCHSSSDTWTNICYTPIPYQRSLEVRLTGRPNWWHIVVTDLPETATVQEVDSFKGTFDPLAIEAVKNRLSNPIYMPEAKDNVLSFVQDSPITYQTENPLTIQSIQITLPKFAVNDFYLRIDDKHGLPLNLPLYAFWGFASDKEITPYQSPLLGIEERGKNYFFYSNLAIPLGVAGGSITLHKNGDPLPARMDIVETQIVSPMRLKVSYDPATFLPKGSADYEINLEGENIRVVGTMLRVLNFVQEQTFIADWVGNYIESNIEVYEYLGWGKWQWRGTWAGIEDFANDSNYFHLWQPEVNIMGNGLISTSPDHKNLALLRTFPGLDGPTGQYGLNFTIEHGAWNDNKDNDAELSYGHTLWYYSK